MAEAKTRWRRAVAKTIAQQPRSAPSGALGIWVIVRGQIPKDMLEDIRRELTADEVAELYKRVHKMTAPAATEPAALFVFGPPAVGKTSLANARATELFGSPSNAVLVDGSEIRDVHGGFQAVAAHGHARAILHADAWNVLKKTKVTTTMKNRVFLEAIADRQNILIPECATDTAKLEQMLNALIAAGFHIHAEALWAPVSETRARGEPRSLREGKLWTPAQYKGSVRGTLEMAVRFAEAMRDGRNGGAYRSLTLWDNTVFPAAPVSLAEFQRLSELGEAEAEEHSSCLKAAKRERESREGRDSRMVAHEARQRLGDLGPNDNVDSDQETNDEGASYLELAQGAAARQVGAGPIEQGGAGGLTAVREQALSEGRVQGLVAGTVAAAVLGSILGYT